MPGVIIVAPGVATGCLKEIRRNTMTKIKAMFADLKKAGIDLFWFIIIVLAFLSQILHTFILYKTYIK